MPREHRALRLAVGLVVALAALAGAPGSRPPLAVTHAQAPGTADWRKEFDDLCARTQDAMALPTPELKSLVERCDRLKPAIDALGDPERKVYAKRLAGCRNLFAYVLASRADP